MGVEHLCLEGELRDPYIDEHQSRGIDPIGISPHREDLSYIDDVLPVNLAIGRSHELSSELKVVERRIGKVERGNSRDVTDLLNFDDHRSAIAMLVDRGLLPPIAVAAGKVMTHNRRVEELREEGYPSDDRNDDDENALSTSLLPISPTSLSVQRNDHQQSLPLAPTLLSFIHERRQGLDGGGRLPSMTADEAERLARQVAAMSDPSPL